MQASIEKTLAELEREGVLTPEQRAIVTSRLADRSAADRKTYAEWNRAQR